MEVTAGVRLMPERDTAGGRVIALAGNPNVGKSTVFNRLTGLNQHTGNWAGKTVGLARGEYVYNGNRYTVVDVPGTYSVTSSSAEEKAAAEFIRSGGADTVVVVCDATCLERNLILVLQTLEITQNVVVCVNLMDEAGRKNIHIDIERLERELGVPAAGTNAAKGSGMDTLQSAIERVSSRRGRDKQTGAGTGDISGIIRKAEEISAGVVTFRNADYDRRDREIDRILTGRFTGLPAMLLLLTAVFWLTITGSNYPSRLISAALFYLQDRLLELASYSGAAGWFSDMMILGVYRVVAWVVSVMLPPMAIFFPLFTLLEDLGYLPRVAFNLDSAFKRCGACGKQALTMCMGFGCNAAGVVGCRIIDSPRERLIAVITNSFVPCNGRFPTLIAVISMFFLTGVSGLRQTVLSAALLTCVIVLGVGMTFAVSRVLSGTVLKGIPSSFVLEMPPYRKPQTGRIIVRSVFDRTLFVLGRAAAAAVPAGLIIWLMSNITVSGASLLGICANALNPFASLLGLDGVILMAFILGFPANEIVVPIIIMAYMSRGNIIELSNLSELKALLVSNGWTWITAVCVILFSLMHWPCSTACLTIRKETRSWKWTAVSFIIPAAAGITVCFLFATAARLFL